MTIIFYQMTIGERIDLIISKLGQNSSAFSKSIGVNPTVIFNIRKGRNSPSYEIFEKIALSYDNINMNWLITGKGNMTIDGDDIYEGSGHSNLNKIEPTQFRTNQELKSIFIDSEIISMIERKDQKIIEMAEEIGKLKSENSALKKDVKLTPYRHASEP